MACHNDHVVYNEEEDLDEDDDYEETPDPPPNVIDEEDDGVEDDGSTSSSNIGADPLPRTSVHPLVPSSSSKLAPDGVTIAVAGIPGCPFRPEFKLQRIEDSVTVTATAAIMEEKKPSAVLDESRKLFQRLWTDEDEIELLQGFLEYTTQRGATNSSHHHHDTTVFYDQIKSKLQLDFNKNQLVEKLRRLKKKYRNVASKMVTGKDYVFKSAHDQATFEISRKIWSNIGSVVRGGAIAGVEDAGYDDEESNPNNIPNFMEQVPNAIGNGADPKTPRSRKRLRGAASSTQKVEEKQGFTQPFYQPLGITNVVTPTATATPTPTPSSNANASSPAVTPPFKAVTLTPATTTKIPGTSIPSLIEETVKQCLSPIFKELMSTVMNMNGSRGLGLSTALSPMPLGLGSEALSPEMMADKKWRRQQMLELEVYSRRLELVQAEIKEQLEQLRSMGS